PPSVWGGSKVCRPSTQRASKQRSRMQRAERGVIAARSACLLCRTCGGAVAYLAGMPDASQPASRSTAHPMFAFGQKQTNRHQAVLSASPPKADIADLARNVRFVP